MSKHIIISFNLLGDFLFTTPAIRAYKQRMNPNDQLILLVNDQQFMQVAENSPYVDKLLYISGEQKDQLMSKYVKYNEKDLYKGLGVLEEFKTKTGETEKACVLEIGRAFHWCTTHPKLVSVDEDGVRKAKVKLPHLAYAFSEQLKVNIDSTHYDLRLTDAEIAEGEEYVSKYSKPVILCAALSSSCTSRDKNVPGLPANKMLSAEVWNEVISSLKNRFDFVFVAAPGEELLPIIDATWEQGLPIRKVASICKAAKAVVSIDTGIAHICGAVDGNLVFIAAAVQSSLVCPETRGRLSLVDHSALSPKPQGINNVKPIEIIEAIQEVTR